MWPRVFAYVNVYLVVAVIIAWIHACPLSKLGRGSSSARYQRVVELQKSWTPGQRIVCVKPNLKGRILGMLHHMVVLDSEHLVHVVEKRDRKFYVNVHHYLHRHFDSLWEKCLNDGFGQFGEQAAQRAREWIHERPLYVKLGSCDCEHYVDYWVDGKRNGRCPSFLD